MIGEGPGRQGIDGGLVQAGDGAQRPGDQVQLILDDQVRRWQPPPEGPSGICAGAIESLVVVALDASEEGAGLAGPGQAGKLIDRGDQQARQAAIDGFVHRQDGQGAFRGEIAAMIDAAHLQIQGLVGVGRQAEGIGFQLRATPGAVLQGDRPRVLSGLLFEAIGTPVGGIVGARAIVALIAQPVGGGRRPHPEADLEGPGAQPRLRGPLQFQGANQGRGPAHLIQGQQPQGVAHQHADPGPAQAGVAQAPQHQDEGRQPQVGLGLAAASGEEQQIHHLAVTMERVRHAPQGEQDVSELEGPPAGRGDLVRRLAFGLGLAPPGRRRHGAVGDTKGQQGIRIGEEGDPRLDAVGRVLRRLQELGRGLGPPAAESGALVALGPHPVPILVHQRHQLAGGVLAVGQLGQGLHTQFHSGQGGGLDPLDLGGG